jgi:hypothetical protein
MATNEFYHGIVLKNKDTIFPGVSSKAFLFGFLSQDKEMRRMPLRISYSPISFLLFIHTCKVIFFLFLLRNK